MSIEPAAAAPRLTPLPALIFSSRWLQLPLYLGLIVAQGVYVFLFVKELWHLIHDAAALTEQAIMLIVLGLIDVVMISNLLVMVIVGGYETFVSRLRLEGHPDQPEWLSHVNASVLKVKLAMAIIGISSIHLLKTFIAAGTVGGLPMYTPAQLEAMAAAHTSAVGCATPFTFLPLALCASAFSIASTSKPWCSGNFWSSAATSAMGSEVEIWSRGRQR